MSEIKRKDAIAGDIIHVYDGIEEADNELPRWWLLLFFGAILFAGGYWLYYEKLRLGPTPRQELALLLAEQAKKAAVVSDTSLLAAAHDPAAVERGQRAFTANCVACHGQKGEGNIGPNLTDDRYLHGGAPLSVFGVVRDGVAAKGMPTWGPILGEAQVKDITAYVLTLRNTHAAGGKAPEGEPWHDR
jgi:cytochrome c oxidase cbb3-type subunit 3